MTDKVYLESRNDEHGGTEVRLTDNGDGTYSVSVSGDQLASIIQNQTTIITLLTSIDAHLAADVGII